ncbi:MAG: hypothetical protein ABI621_10380 [Chloroflexota bacterium]
MAFKDIRKSRKWLSPEEIRILVVLLIILSAALALNIYLARVLPAGEWLYLRWSGVRAFLFEQIEPYSTAIAQRVQQIVYERNAFPTEYRYVLNDPLYIVLLYTPLALFPNFQIARAVWMLVCEVALIFTVLFSFRLSEWEPPRWLYVGLFGFGLLSFFSLNALITASPAIFLSLLYLSILLALRSYSDELAGALLFLAAYQWEVGGLFFIFILVFVFANRRWGVLGGFGMSLFVLLIVSFLVNPDWGLPYIRAVLSNLYQSANLNLGYILAGWFPDARFPIGRWISIFLIAIVFVESLAAVQGHFRRNVWVASLALAAMPLTGLAIFPSNYVVLLLPLVVILTLAWERWLRRRIFVIVLILLVAFFVPFGLYLQSVSEYAPLYTELLSVLPPVAAILGLYWMRWWVIRSPRTWADQIGFLK